MKLNRTERNKVDNIMNDFSSVHYRIEKLESKINEIDEERTLLLNELKQIRSNEKNLLDKLKEKYGEDHSLDLETFEIKETIKLC